MIEKVLLLIQNSLQFHMKDDHPALKLKQLLLSSNNVLSTIQELLLMLLFYLN